VAEIALAIDGQERHLDVLAGKRDAEVALSLIGASLTLRDGTEAGRQPGPAERLLGLGWQSHLHRPDQLGRIELVGAPSNTIDHSLRLGIVVRSTSQRTTT